MRSVEQAVAEGFLFVGGTQVAAEGEDGVAVG